MPKVAICIPTYSGPHPKTAEALTLGSAYLKSKGWEVSVLFETGCPYISHARAKLLRKALDLKVDSVIFVDHDVAFSGEALLKVLETHGDVVCGTYRFKKQEVEYMGAWRTSPDGFPLVRIADGAIDTTFAPAGFLRITPECVNKLIKQYPDLLFGDRHTPHVDIFKHGANDHVWYGEDYAFCLRWVALGEKIWTVPDIDIDHWAGKECYKGNLHEYFKSLPQGMK